ncbi:hypothetical protein JMJ56_07410 [Belnapia sp. T18]|uniref:EAL domain-containing protein n=1 Tax=Belnapia arida TaxID=2804533 RepID=A0ABS1TZH1_9PROT|nr:hypothetical protein [Belnapia arida]MBL6077826.1 hypothetical protein [Belnapia arida]
MTVEPSLAPLRPFAGPRGADALALAHFLREAVAAGTVREVLHLRLGALAEELRRSHHQRLVRDALAPLMRPTRARVFELPNGDIVAIAPPEGRHLGEVQEALGILFAAEGQLPFARRRRLPEEAAALLAAVEESLTPNQAAPRWPVPEEERPPISAADLVALERGLGHASLARFLVRRPVCRLAPGEAGPEAVWEDWSLHWAELCATLLPGADPALAPALFRRLRRLADRRLLSELARPEDARRLGQAGLSLAPETVAEPEFLRLDAALGPERRGRMTVCFAAGDALADTAGFAFARDFCRLRGWRVALDLAAPVLLPALPLAGLQVDLLRLRWSAALPGFAAALPADRAKVMLSGADRAAAIGWGWEAGITLFEGRLLRPRG